MGEKFIANIDIPENDSLISAAWFGDGCLSDGSIFVTPNPVAVSSAVKKCSPAKPKTGREDSSSSLGILSPNTFAGTSRQLIQDDFLNLDLAPEVDVDQGELDELVASFESNACANDDSLMGSDGKATHVEQDFSDAERTLKAAQQFCTPISHLQPQSSTGKDSVLKITDTVYKRKKPKGVQLAEVKSKPQLPFGCRNTLSELPVVSGTSELSPEQNIADFNEEFVCGKVLNVKLLYPDVFEKPTRVKHMQDVVQELKFGIIH
ncbi:hypothetical protein TTRE_0000928601 [Trichuris trichiura]|uniref:Uncharacterized protein n=1 Tax=Trichuris trichiura TaxID=36087 RepID=A0A077ZKI9_TRITR|nr:hypothetical protein TTRE_0000928601 [Trichuris trichiura]